MIDNAAALSPLPIEDAPLFGVFEGLRACERIPPATMSMRLARQSIVAGLALSGVAMIFAAFGFIAPTEGALLQEAIDVAVILNALRASWS